MLSFGYFIQIKTSSLRVNRKPAPKELCYVVLVFHSSIFLYKIKEAVGWRGFHFIASEFSEVFATITFQTFSWTCILYFKWWIKFITNLVLAFSHFLSLPSFPFQYKWSCYIMRFDLHVACWLPREWLNHRGQFSCP